MSDDRFDKFTPRARRVLTLSQEEATRFNHNYIGTEHLLLGLVREGDGVAARVLAELGVEVNRVRSAVEFIIGRGDRMIVGEIGLTPRANKVIELAVDEARRLGQEDIGTEHLLLGLVREGEGIAAGVLESLGVNLEKVRVETIRVLSQLGPIAAAAEEATDSATGATLIPLPGNIQSRDAGRFDRFTERARKILTLAQEDAARLNHNYIGTEHLLLGLVREGEGVAAKVLANLGVTPNRVRGEVQELIGRGGRMTVGEIGLTPRAKKVMELAVDEARRLGHHYIGAEHLLLGLVREGDGIAAKVLESLGVNLEKARTQTIQILSQSSTTYEWQGSSGGVSMPSSRQSEQGQPAPAGPARWAYCVVQVAYLSDEGGVIRRVQGGGDETCFGRDTTPLYHALETLGDEGWELVAVDTAFKDTTGEVGVHYYVFKRPLQT